MHAVEGGEGVKRVGSVGCFMMEREGVVRKDHFWEGDAEQICHVIHLLRIPNGPMRCCDGPSCNVYPFVLHFQGRQLLRLMLL